VFPTFGWFLLLALLGGMNRGHDSHRRHVGYRRLQVRYERRADVLLGFVHLACALICLKFMRSPAW
jgi:hypothetical protein